MPTSQEILSGLSAIANQWRLLAILWHLFFGALVVAFVFGFRPSKRASALLLTLPLFSVSALAWLAANPFNGILTGLAALILLGIALRLPNEKVQITSSWFVWVGALLALFGWFYPHFLQTTSWLPYLYAAPTGLVPCPTLSIITGVSLMLAGLESRPWSIVLGVMGLFYGLFGAMRLGVIMDLVLLLGAVVCIALLFLPKGGAPKATLAARGV